ncbi:MAG: ABC transporter substrate-binding protein [Lachnospiraceae bacterium]|nr:ABC transporter substrate-binding protein [Lachnospiraceae bacterium]
MKKFMKQMIALLLCGFLLAGCGAQSVQPKTAEAEASTEETAEETTNEETSVSTAEDTNGETRTFTDSLGREVIVPVNIERIALTGPMAQIVVFALAPDKLVGISSEWDEVAAEYLNTEYYELPVIGQLHGGKGELNLEELLKVNPQVIIDVGEPKGELAKELDELQEQTTFPFVHITASLSTMSDAYTMLGDLLGMEEEAAELGAYCKDVYDRISLAAEGVEKKRLLFITGEEGLNVIAQGSYHAEVIDLLSDNLAVVDDPSSKGTGNEVDFEQILNWNPDVILFSPDSIFDTVATLPEWQEISAIKNGTYYKVPYGPHNWMGFQPSVQRMLGLQWMFSTLYPEAAAYDLYEQVAEYYRLFYHCELSKEQFDALVN